MIQNNELKNSLKQIPCFRDYCILLPVCKRRTRIFCHKLYKYVAASESNIIYRQIFKEIFSGLVFLHDEGMSIPIISNEFFNYSSSFKSEAGHEYMSNFKSWCQKHIVK
jgi:hypothetical protein